MGDVTNISWADHTFNPWVGCTKISNGPLGACPGCYAAAMMEDRYHRVVFGGPEKGAGTRERTSAANWRKPLAWNRAAAAAGTRSFVFCASLADVFDNEAPADWRRDLFELIRSTPHLIWLLLTKRPQNIVRMVKEVGFMPSNIAFGSTVENRATRDTNLPALMVAAGLRPLFLFLSCEPLMEDLGDLSPWLPHARTAEEPYLRHPWPQMLDEGERWERGFRIDAEGWPAMPALAWIITGGETNQGAHRARPSNPQWFREVRDQCAAAGVAFHHKQNGEWLGTGQEPEEVICYGRNEHHAWPDDAHAYRVGKKNAGRLLDGAVHNARPTLNPVIGAAA